MWKPIQMTASAPIMPIMRVSRSRAASSDRTDLGPAPGLLRSGPVTSVIIDPLWPGMNERAPRWRRTAGGRSGQRWPLASCSATNGVTPWQRWPCRSLGSRTTLRLSCDRLGVSRMLVIAFPPGSGKSHTRDLRDVRRAAQGDRRRAAAVPSSGRPSRRRPSGSESDPVEGGGVAVLAGDRNLAREADRLEGATTPPAMRRLRQDSIDLVAVRRQDLFHLFWHSWIPVVVYCSARS